MRFLSRLWPRNPPPLDFAKLTTALDEVSSLCCDELYFCPRAGEIECPHHGGFTTCCDRSSWHVPLVEVRSLLAAHRGPEQQDPRSAYEALYRRRADLRRILLDWDPIGIKDPEEPWPEDEYDCLISPLIGALLKGAGRTEIHALLNREMDDHFGLPDSRATDQVVSRILQWSKA